MGPYAVEAVGAFQVIGNLGQALHAFFPGDEAAFDTYQQSGYTKSAAAGGDNILVLFGIIPIQVDAFACQSGGRFRTVPHVVQMYLLDVIKHFVIRSE